MSDVRYIIMIFVVLISEIYCYEYNHSDSLWTNNFRILSWIAIASWYYDTQKRHFTYIQKIFFLSILLPIIVSLSSYLIPERQAIIVNLFINITILGLWIFTFKQMGASIVLNDSKRTLTKVIPAFFVFPLFFYYFILFQSLPFVYAIIVLIYILFFSYMGILSAFLPFREVKRRWVVISIVFLIFINIMNAYHTFLQELSWAYPVLRTVTVISKCMMIYGMIPYVEKKTIKFI